MDPKSSFRDLFDKTFWISALPLDSAERHPAGWVAALSGASLGLVWGIAARLWMRLIATSPEFSIPGTLGILLVATLFGGWAGLAYAARRRGWQGWRHYVPRVLVVIFFLPFGAAGGMPLMLTTLVATLGLTQRALPGLWVLAGLVMLVAAGTDISIPLIFTVAALAGAIALTVWKWFMRSQRSASWSLKVDTWLERIGRAILLLLACFGLWTVASGIMADKAALLGLVGILLYLLLLYPLLLALRIGLAPKMSVVTD